MASRRLLPFLAVLVLAGCGRSGAPGAPQIGQSKDEPTAAASLGFPSVATKNTTRVGGSDAVADAAAIAVAVHPGTSSTTRPAAVALVDAGNWQAGIAGAVLASQPLSAPLLLTDGGDVPAATRGALKALAPRGSPDVNGAQAIVVGSAGTPGGYRATHVGGSTPAALAAAIDHLVSATRGKPSRNVVVVSDAQPSVAMPAAGWAAKSGDSILFVNAKGAPAETVAALKAHAKPAIYVLGPPTVVPDAVLNELRRYGSVIRIAGADPVANAVTFARYKDDRFGWGVSDPGHGLVIASTSRPLDAAAAAPLSAAGVYGPLLLLDSSARLSPTLSAYLLDIQPGYETDPVRGLYNHGWLIGDTAAISEAEQAEIDALLEIMPVQTPTPRKNQAPPAKAKPKPAPAPSQRHNAPAKPPAGKPQGAGGGQTKTKTKTQ